MAGQIQMTGNVGGPTPWWQLPGGGAAQQNLQNSAPKGYAYDAVRQGYQKTPTQQGGDRGAMLSGFLNSSGSLNGLMNSTQQTTQGGGAAGNVPGGASGGVTGSGGGVQTGAPIPTVATPDTTAATNAAFATAKDQAGAMSRASLTSLNDELGASGMVGSGAQVQGTQNIIQSGAGQVGQASRDLAGKNADQAADFAKMGYQGQITQRGQDIAAQEASARLAQEARLAEQQRQQAMIEMMMRGSGGGSSDSGGYY